MRLGIVSDTHGQLDSTRQAVRLLQQEQVDVVLHCGDIGSGQIVSLFDDWPTHFVFGNCDLDPALIRGVIRDSGQTCHEVFGEIELAGRRIALLHSDDRRRFRETVESGAYDLVCYGHTHSPETHLVGRTRVLNPGALCRAERYTVAIVDLPEVSVRHVDVDRSDSEASGSAGE